MCSLKIKQIAYESCKTTSTSIDLANAYSRNTIHSACLLQYIYHIQHIEHYILSLSSIPGIRNFIIHWRISKNQQFDGNFLDYSDTGNRLSCLFEPAIRV